MQESSKIIASGIINERRPKTILDSPCGGGWLLQRLDYKAEADGIDLYDTPKGGYRRLIRHDLDEGVPKDLPSYDCIACCEGLEHLGNPSLFVKTARRHLNDGGFLMITTPNVWYPASKLQFLMRGFFPGFPPLAGKIEKGTHMHITPWSYPQLHLYLRLNGFRDIRLHDEPLSGPKHLFERFLGLPQKIYCKNKYKKAGSAEERDFWTNALASVWGRHLIVTAEK